MPLYLILAALGLAGFGVYEMIKAGTTGAGPGGGGGGGAPPAGVPSPPFNLAYPGSGAWQNNASFIRQYQGALMYLAWKTGNASWSPTKADGTYGPETAAAVKAFESANGLTPDGECGPECVSALQSALSSAQASGLELVGMALAQAGARFRGVFAGRDEDHMGHMGAMRNPFRGVFPGRDEDHMGAMRSPFHGVFPGRDEDHMGAMRSPFHGVFPGRDEDHMGAMRSPFSGTFPGRDEDHMGTLNWLPPPCLNWVSMQNAPPALKTACLAVLRTMKQDPSIPYGTSVHTVNGTLVKFDKYVPPSAASMAMHRPTVVAVAYCAR